MVVSTGQHTGGGEAVPDTLSQGGDDERSPWPRRVIVAVVLVLAVVVIVQRLPRSRQAPARSAQAAATLASPVPIPRAAKPVTLPGGITGPALAWPSGLRLPVTGQQPEWFSPGTGRVALIGGLPRWRAGYQFTRAAGGWAIQANPDTQADCGDCVAPLRAVYFLADRAQAAVPVGLADAVAPGAAGSLWLTSYPPAVDPGTAAGMAREVSTAGRALGPPLRLPSGYLIEQATSRGLLLAPASPAPGITTSRLWEPSTRADSRAFDTVVAASATQIAWAPPCARRCQVLMLNLATGRQVTADLPAGRSVTSAAFSPSGRYLAVETSFSSEADDGGQAVQLELAATVSGHLEAVPGTWLSSDALISFGWPAGRDSLVAELSFTAQTQLTSWRPGASRLAIVGLATRQHLPTLITGQYTS